MTNKDIIKQYVDSGICIPEYQMNKLNSGLLKTYLRKRLMVHTVNIFDLRKYELNKLSENDAKNYISKHKIYIYDKLEEGEYITPDEEDYFINKMEFNELTPEEKRSESISRAENGWSLCIYQWVFLNDEEKLKYLSKFDDYRYPENHFRVEYDGEWFDLMNIDTKVKYILDILVYKRNYHTMCQFLSNKTGANIKLNDVTIFNIREILNFFRYNFNIDILYNFAKNNLNLILNKETYDFFIKNKNNI